MRRLWAAFLNSLSGLKIAFHDEAAFRQDLVLTILLTPLAFWLAPDRISLVLMLMPLPVILIAELLNTAIEAAIDRIGPEHHPLSKKAKDTASAAVLGALVLLVIAWAPVLISRFVP